MRSLIISLLFAGCSLHSFSQQTENADTLPGGKDFDPANVSTTYEMESSFPGGVAGWRKFLQDNLVYPDKAVKKNIQGTVVLQFIVDKDGSIADLKALSGPPILQDAALKAMKNSPKWIPAVQHQRYVKSYKRQPILFRF